jgi:hypothetical protein
VASDPQNHNEVTVAADSSGRVWVFWSRDVSGTPHVFARRATAAGLEPTIDMGAPAGTTVIHGLDASIDSAGNPDVLALAEFGNGSAGTYFAQGPQMAAPPPPQNGRSVDVFPVSGTTLVRLAGQTAFTRLVAGEQIPVGATVDTTHGRVRLKSARSTRGGVQTADFFDGEFVVRQRRGKALTTLALAGGNAAVCAHHAPNRQPVGQIAGRRHRRRRLWGSGSGSYSTSGSYASATVRGTIWLTEDDCEGTLISVRRGTVVVRDFVRHKVITVRAPHSYFAAK